MEISSEELLEDENVTNTIFDILVLNVQVLEQYLIHFPFQKVAKNLKKEIGIIFRLASYNPQGEADDEEEEDDEDYDDYDDEGEEDEDPDSSWKVREAAVKYLQTFLELRSDLLNSNDVELISETQYLKFLENL